jgi:hypothetical protein
MNLLDGDFLGSMSKRLIDKLINEFGGMQFSRCLCTWAQSVTKQLERHTQKLNQAQLMLKSMHN